MSEYQDDETREEAAPVVPFIAARWANPEGTSIVALDGNGGRWAALPGDPRLSGLTVAPYEEPEETNLRLAIKAQHAARVAAGLPVAGFAGHVDMDPESRSVMQGAAMMATLGAWPPEGFWRLSDNQNAALSPAGLMRMAVTAGGYYTALFNHRSALLDAEAAGDQPDPRGGWPEPPVFNPVDEVEG